MRSLPFRQAHEIAADVATAVVRDGDVLSNAFEGFRTAFERHAERPPTLDEDGFRQAVSPEHFVAVRERFGGPGPKAMDEALGRLEEALDGLDAEAEARRAHERHAEATLAQAFGALES